MTRSDGIRRLVRRDGDIDLVVDVANVCLNEALREHSSRWDALVRVLEAWVARFGTPRAVLACDYGLHFDGDQETFDRLVRWGASATPWPLVLTGLDHADPHILKIAEQTGASVLTLDRYLDLRRDHPWIGGTTDRFFGWRVTAQTGAVELVARSMLVSGEFTISDAEQAREDKRRGLVRDVLDDALAWHFRCTTDDCVWHVRFPERLRDLPVARGGGLVCPQCKHPVQRTEPRLPSRFVKLSSPTKTVRAGVESGESFVVGRGPVGLANRVLAHGDLRKISASHIEIAFDGQQVTAHELGSTNGTSVETWSPRDRAHREPIALQSYAPVVLRPNDRLLLAGVLKVALSGHRAPPARGHGRGVPAPAPDATEVALERRERPAP